jgi:sugar phosphate isomerase/epimerase
MENFFIQLYSLKDEVAKDFIGTLNRVSKIGYTGVEFAGSFYGGFSAMELKIKLIDLKLDAFSTHIKPDQVAGQLDFTSELGVKYIIDPMAMLSCHEETLSFAEKLNVTGKLCKGRNITFGYHNHRHEFLEGKDGYLLETLLLNTDPELVCFQLDVGWAACAGVDVPAFIKKYPGRFKLIHVKECSTVAGPEKMHDFSKSPWIKTVVLEFRRKLLRNLLSKINGMFQAGKVLLFGQQCGMRL